MPFLSKLLTERDVESLVKHLLFFGTPLTVQLLFMLVQIFLTVGKGHLRPLHILGIAVVSEMLVSACFQWKLP